MKTTGIRPNLQLDKITGIRHDLGQRMTYVPVKKEQKIPYQKKSMKTKANIKEGKWQF
jgi:hypothetical protein